MTLAEAPRSTEGDIQAATASDVRPIMHRVVVLAHCGPHGLGATRESIYGCDFRPEQGDWGDRDLAEALEYARECGKRVVAVVAGHMHHALRGGGERVWRERRDGRARMAP